jgi:hypothetical protein
VNSSGHALRNTAGQEAEGAYRRALRIRLCHWGRSHRRGGVVE